MYNYFCAPTARYAQCLLINAANTDMQTPNKLRSTTPLRSGLSKTIIHTHTYEQTERMNNICVIAWKLQMVDPLRTAHRTH